MKNKRLVLSAALTFALALPQPARSESGPQFRDLKSQAMGRSGVASAGGPLSLFFNPAALADFKGGTLGVSTDLGLNSVLLDYATWAADNYKYLNNMDSLLARIGPVDNKWAPFSQTFAIYGQYEGIAFAAVEDLRYNLTIGKAVVTPVPGVGALSDLTLMAGRGFQAPEGYRFGVGLKYVYRIRFDDRLVGTTDDEFYKVKNAWDKPDKGFFDKLAKLQVADEIADTRMGLGVNLGAEKDVSDNWTAGVSLLDFPTIMAAEFVRPDINLGVAYHRPVEFVQDLDQRLLVNVDYQHFLLPGTPWFKQLKMGIALEGAMKGRPAALIAMGINDGYPTFGIRVGYIGYLSYVYVAQEVGTYPGQEKLSFHKISFDLAY